VAQFAGSGKTRKLRNILQAAPYRLAPGLLFLFVQPV
jgi:hypothetical protein